MQGSIWRRPNIYKRRVEIWKDADFDTPLRPGDVFLN